jgi:hypothetical protein
MKNQKKIEETNKKWVEERCKILVQQNLSDFERAIIEEWSEPQLATAA